MAALVMNFKILPRSTTLASPGIPLQESGDKAVCKIQDPNAAVIFSLESAMPRSRLLVP